MTIPPLDHVEGDATGLTIPAHTAALTAAGPQFLTKAMRAFGALGPDNAVREIVRIEPCAGGSTGEKCFLSVTYERPDPALHCELFVKFSRDFSDAGRDNRGKHEMVGEVRFARYAAQHPLPVPTPRTYFADYNAASHTGMLITETIPFGNAGIEPQHQKCMDHLLGEPLAYYRVIVEALARIAAIQCRAEEASAIEAVFAYDAQALAASTGLRITASEVELREKLAELAAFVDDCGHLLPPGLALETIGKVAREAPQFLRRQEELSHYLTRPGPLIALCHWNANIDNCWFWRDREGQLHCGLMDWGNAGQINLAFALWGCLSGAPSDIWTDHLDELLGHFAATYAAASGAGIDADELLLNLRLYISFMGLSYFLDSPARIRARTPDLHNAHSYRDPLVTQDQSTRNQLHMLGNVLTVWQRFGLGADALPKLPENAGS
ncbi:hypothetical protein EDF56_102280 [Novosphingobium sp. PhB165]|uniref:hypothetical protein n=1 Tax=Novosphingobium sp. PhB165 TaxID=2485105 RepID=UPI0010513A26|nr:hypothetical protein [Novosphingobium sp. PhB165]TCM20619.1 hypothetical protein EDF56_102280 [Novosphingobium sp. PhB165]